MNLPRIRFTIGQLMVTVVLVGLLLGGFLIPRLVAEQRIRVQQTEAKYKQAKLVREVAEYAVKEYVEGIYKQEKQTYLGQIALAKSDLEQAINRLLWSAAMKERGFVPDTTIDDGIFARNRSEFDPEKARKLQLWRLKEKAQFDLEQAQTQLEVLEKYTMTKQIKWLNSDVAKAKTEEQSALAAYQSEKSKLRWLGY